MKKWVLLTLLFLIGIPVVFAGVSFDPLTETEVNPGATVGVSGFVESDTSVQGYFELAVVCESGEFKLPKVALSLKAKERRSFPGDIAIPKVSVSNSMKGSCRVRGELTQDGAVLGTATSEMFQVSPRLIGDFSIDVERIQAGDSFSLTGKITRVNGDQVTGSAEIYFVTNGERFLADVVSFTEGNLQYKYNSIGIPSGNYTVVIIVNDLYGTSQEFSSVATFTLLSDLFVFAKSSADKVDPADSIKVSGEARTLLNDVVEDGEVFVTLENQTYTTEVNSAGEFEINVPIPPNIKSGQHKINVRVEDTYRNIGKADIPIEVIPLHTAVTLEVSDAKVAPGNKIMISGKVIDQAADPIDEQITIEVRDAENKVFRTDSIRSGGKIEISFAANAIPGNYKVYGSSGSLKSEATFAVDAVEALDFSVEGQDVVVENDGNVKYDGLVTVQYTPDLKEEKTISILPGQSVRIPLGLNIPTGVYDLIVSSGKFKEDFKSVMINGIIPKNFTQLYWAIAILTLALMAFSIYWMSYKERRALHQDATMKKNYRREIELIKQKKASGEKPFVSKYSVGSYDKDKVASDYRKQVLKQIKESEAQMASHKKNSSYSFNRPSGSGSSAFNKPKKDEDDDGYKLLE